jgi:uncharacterized protein (DUF58 family)
LWTKVLSREFKAFAGLFLAGLILQNMVLIFISLAPLLYLVIGHNLERPRGIKPGIERTRKKAWVNENLSITSPLQIESGSGLVTYHQTLPPFFSLSKGNNFHVFFKGRRPFNAEEDYWVRCTRRGFYATGTVTTESMHALAMETGRVDSFCTSLEILVRPVSLDPRRMRDPRLTSRIPLPIGAISKIGPTTTDFKEIREYRPGDLFRNINWKATARMSRNPNMPPVVNDYEREGRKNVWVFLDCGSGMKIGSSVENAFEYAVQAVGGLSEYYLSRSCNVGVVFYNYGKTILPDLGRRQKGVIARALIKMEMTSMTGGLRAALRSCKGRLIGTNPLFIVVTSLHSETHKDLHEGIMDMRRFGGPRTQTMLVHVSGYDVLPRDDIEKAGAILANLSLQPLMRDLRASGTFVVPWDPRAQSFQRLMIMGVKRRR